MSLFKRIILSLFPEQFQGTINSIGVFLGLINTKLFFTVINKRMVENPKLNQFDIGLDTVETKIGFGNEAHIKPKDLDLYFSYCAAANMNGHKFYSITTIGALSSIAFSPYFINDFPRNKKGTDYYMIVLICINIVSYLFGSRIKVFPPHMNDNESFHRCIEIFFTTYRYLLQAYSVKVTDAQFEALKNKLLVHIDVFFSLYMIYKRINTLLKTNHYDEDFLQWMYSQEIKKNKSNQTKLNEFISCYQEYKYESAFRGFEDTLLDIIMPAEIMIKLLYNREDVFLISERIIPAIYKPSSIEKHLANTMTHKDQYVDKLLEYIMDHKPRKEYFFPTVKKMVVEAFHENRFGDEEVEEWLSSISDGSSLFTIPHQLKKEGMMMDRLLNFYVGLLGTFWIGRGDSLELRLCYPDIFTHHQDWSGGRESMNYCNTYLHTRNKNAFFYKTIFDGVRSGKQSFLIPYTAQVKEVYNYGYIIEQMHQSSLAIILQDFLTNDIKLSIHQAPIIKQFELLHGQTIQSVIELNQVSFIEQYYH
ncbi:MAG TPA: hypothetical protein PLW93_05290, partial [Candidatus Absconditabacterales bacterium]|nr:hypothetical protein [Candidatus Absconditabacterales bacterium]